MMTGTCTRLCQPLQLITLLQHRSLVHHPAACMHCVLLVCRRARVSVGMPKWGRVREGGADISRDRPDDENISMTALAPTDASDFPLFRRRFLGGATWNSLEAQRSGGVGFPSMGDPEPRRSTPGNHIQRPNLKTLDLRALPREDGPPSETQLRRQKYQFFEKQCSEIADGLFLSGDWVAKNREVLQQNGITHVVNCVGFICKEYFKGELDYRTYFLQGGWHASSMHQGNVLTLIC